MKETRENPPTPEEKTSPTVDYDDLSVYCRLLCRRVQGYHPGITPNIWPQMLSADSDEIRDQHLLLTQSSSFRELPSWIRLTVWTRQIARKARLTAQTAPLSKGKQFQEKRFVGLSILTATCEMRDSA